MDIFTVLGFLVFGFFMFVGISASAAGQKSIKMLSDSRCPACGGTYGLRIAEEARSQFATICAEAQQRAQMRAMINCGHYWPVECPKCGYESAFDSVENRIVEL